MTKERYVWIKGVWFLVAPDGFARHYYYGITLYLEDGKYLPVQDFRHYTVKLSDIEGCSFELISKYSESPSIFWEIPESQPA